MINQTEIYNNVLAEGNANQNYNNVDSTWDLLNNANDPENNDRNSDAYNIQESNNNGPFSAPRVMFLPPIEIHYSLTSQAKKKKMKFRW